MLHCYINALISKIQIKKRGITMKKIMTAALLCALPLSVSFAGDDAKKYAAESKAVVKEFFGQLKGELGKSMKAGGPVATIEVCSKTAPEIAKALSDLPEDIAKALEAEREELTAAREEVAKADIEKADRAYISKMEALPGIVDSPEEFGPVLREIAAKDENLAKAVEDVLTNANKRIEAGDLFVEKGSVSAPAAGGDAMEKATNIAKSMVESNPELSLEEARSRVWESNPELYDEYNSEREAAK